MTDRLEEIRQRVDMARAHSDAGGVFTHENVEGLLRMFEEVLSVMLPEQADALDGVALRATLRPEDRFSRKAVTRASRLLTLAAGGEIIVPFHLADIVDQIELDQIDQPSRSRVIYRARHVKAAGAVIDAVPIAPPSRRLSIVDEPDAFGSGKVIDQ